jgi:hypothetical protein
MVLRHGERINAKIRAPRHYDRVFTRPGTPSLAGIRPGTEARRKLRSTPTEHHSPGRGRRHACNPAHGTDPVTCGSRSKWAVRRVVLAGFAFRLSPGLYRRAATVYTPVALTPALPEKLDAWAAKNGIDSAAIRQLLPTLENDAAPRRRPKAKGRDDDTWPPDLFHLFSIRIFWLSVFPAKRLIYLALPTGGSGHRQKYRSNQHNLAFLPRVWYHQGGPPATPRAYRTNTPLRVPLARREFDTPFPRRHPAGVGGSGAALTQWHHRLQ